MTTNAMTSVNGNASRRGEKAQYSHLSQLIFHVTVYDEDNDNRLYEIMADSFSEANATAEALAMDDMINIQYMTVEVMG